MGFLFNSLTADERETITNYIREWSNDAGHPPENLEYVLRAWEEAKDVNLFQLLGGKLILEKDVEFSIPKDQLVKDMEALAYGSNSQEGHPCFKEISDFIFAIRNACVADLQERWGYTAKQARDMVLEWRRYHNNFDSLSLLTGCRYLVDNKFTPCKDGQGRTYVSFPVPYTDKILKFSYGEKLIKVYGKICKALNIPDFEDFRIKHSQVLNQKKLKGKLCLSIHPLDYMTMSDNDCGWESCMSWRECGDYRQGTVEMMNSKYVIMAYLKSDKDVEFTYPVEWSNKKWRQLFVVSPELLLGIRQYPYDSSDLRGFALNWIRELAIKNLGWKQFPTTTVKVNNDTSNIFDNRTVQVRLSMNHMYNDISRDHLSYLSDNVKDKDVIDIFLSGVSECMICGALNDISDSCDLACDDCGGGYHCEHCGKTLHSDDVYWVEGLCYCEDCYYDYTSTCASCDESYLDNNLSSVNLRIANAYIPYHSSVCSWCKSNTPLQRLMKKNPESAVMDYYIDIEDINTNEEISKIENVFNICDWDYFKDDALSYIERHNPEVIEKAKIALASLDRKVALSNLIPFR